MAGKTGEPGNEAYFTAIKYVQLTPDEVKALIARDQEMAFDSKVKSIASRFDKLTFKYTGPWPPYNFVNIRLKLERAGHS